MTKYMQTPALKRQRIRDPLHDIVEFDTSQFEHMLWRVVQTAPFQRLRRVRQLGFSEFVFPGATHTRFAHSIGVFHIARELMGVIKRHVTENKIQFKEHQMHVALAASLVHDVGHGMFSHAFEAIGKDLNLSMAKHEKVSVSIISDSEISREFEREFGSGFAVDVASVINGAHKGSLYNSVVSSQFDADRLDYMQRDRMMTGVKSSGIDAAWLMANLEVASIQRTVDDQNLGSIETLVLGPKAFHSAENYVLSLFQLYPNIYYHKTTRAAEKLFSELMKRVIDLIKEDSGKKTGLPKNHPVWRFSEEPDSLSRALALDDHVFWGSLPMLVEAGDDLVKECAKRFLERRLPKCIDIRRLLEQEIPHESDPLKARARTARIKQHCVQIEKRIRERAETPSLRGSLILFDQAKRDPYKRFQDSQTPLNQIMIRLGGESVQDMADLSPAVANATAFEVCRVYVGDTDVAARGMIEDVIRNEMRTCGQGNDDV